jgi:hypothetical protein
MSETMYGYAYVSEIKKRVLGKSTDTSFDSEMQKVAYEASRLIDNVLYYYTANLTNTDTRNPIYWQQNTSNVPPQITDIANDLGASIFKRRMLPNEVKIRGPQLPLDNQEVVIDSQGWYALAWSKLQSFIRSNYVKPKMKIVSSNQVQSDPLSKGYTVN